MIRIKFLHLIKYSLVFAAALLLIGGGILIFSQYSEKITEHPGRVTFKLLPLDDKKPPTLNPKETLAVSVKTSPTVEPVKTSDEKNSLTNNAHPEQTSVVADNKTPEGIIVSRSSDNQVPSNQENDDQHQEAGLIVPLKHEVKLVNTSPVFNPDNKKQMCIILTGLGLDQALLTNILDNLDPAITLAFYPTVDDVASQMSEARRRGHELLILVPMEPLEYPQNDPGSNTLLTGLSTQENLQRLDNILAPLKNYVGIMNFFGSRFTTSETDYEPIIKEFQKRHLLLIDHFSAPRSLARELGVKHNLPVVQAKLWLDHNLPLEKIRKQLDDFAYQAEENDSLVIVANAYPIIVQLLIEWQKHLSEKPVILVPISATVNVN